MRAQLQALSLDEAPSDRRHPAVSKAVLLVRRPQANGSQANGSHANGSAPTGWAPNPAPLAGMPAPLLPVANRALLLHALDAIRDAGLTDAAIVTERALAPVVRQLLQDGWRHERLRVEVIDAPASDGLVEASEFVGSEPFLLHLADSLHQESIDCLLDDPALGPDDARILTCSPPEDECSRLTEGSLRPRVEALGPGWLRAEPLDHAGVYVLGHRAMDVAGPHGSLEPAGLVEALGQHGGSVSTHRSPGAWRLGTRVDGWLEGNRVALEGLRVEPTNAHVSDSDIQGKVSIHPTAEVRSCVLRGPAVIGPMARLSDSYVGPYSSVGAGVRIEAAELEHSIILPGASIRHLGVRLEASIIGPHARVYRDFRLPRALRLNLGEGAEVVLD